jgi:L-2,4-diaminobutyrate decarboxylase
MAKWKDILEEKIIPAFPKPWADHGADERFEEYLKSVVHKMDALKHGSLEGDVYLGKPDIWITDQSSLEEVRKNAKLPVQGQGQEAVSDGLVNFFNGMVDWGHPKMGMNIVPPSTMLSIAAHLMAAMFSPNLIEEEYSANVVAAEIETVSMCAQLAGYDQLKAQGIFTFGGLGTWLYALKVGLTKALGKDSRARGIRQNAQILTSEASHFSKVITADWSGLGTDNIREISLDRDNSMNLESLRDALEACHKEGLPVGLINCTMGTTDAFGVDDLEKVADIRDKFVAKHNLDYKPHIHADAVIGWAWMVYRHYDFTKNPLEFEPQLLSDLKCVAKKFHHIDRADSIGFDFHKTGYTPYISSMFLLKDGTDFDLVARPAGAESYLFHFGAYNPGEYSLESSRTAAGALAAWANLKYFGLEGFQVLLARLVKMERLLRKFIDDHPEMVVINDEDHGFVTLYRVYPKGKDAKDLFEEEFAGRSDDSLKEHNEYLYQISHEINRRQREDRGPFLSFTTNHRTNQNGVPIAALKVFPTTPFADALSMEQIAHSITESKETVDKARLEPAAAKA